MSTSQNLMHYNDHIKQVLVKERGEHPVTPLPVSHYWWSIVITCTNFGVLSSTVLNRITLMMTELGHWVVLWEWTTAWKHLS